MFVTSAIRFVANVGLKQRPFLNEGRPL